MIIVTIATTGNATDFGDLTRADDYVVVLLLPRGVWCGGLMHPGDTSQNTIDYVTISATGNAFDFGDLSSAEHGVGTVSNNTRGLAGGGYDQSNYRTPLIKLQFLH